MRIPQIRSIGALPICLALILTACGAIAPGPAGADTRRFVWSYESTTAPRGSGEYEQWVTWKTDKPADDLYDRLEFRHELEYGLSDRLQVGFYFANWRYTRTSAGSNTEVRTSAVEVIYNLTDPYASGLGSALYGEIALGQEKFAVEAKLLLEKPVGPVTLVANTILEAEWEHEDWVDDIGKFEQTLGLSRELSPRLLVGLEALAEIEFDDWQDASPTLYYAGPNASYRAGKWWVTSSPLFQVSDRNSEPDLMWRTLVGILF